MIPEFPPELKPFLDAEGRLRQWPAKLKLQLMAVDALAVVIPAGAQYTEKQINEMLNAQHTFKDPAMLRRFLYDRGHLARTNDGRAYWRVERPATEGS